MGSPLPLKERQKIPEKAKWFNETDIHVLTFVNVHFSHLADTFPEQLQLVGSEIQTSNLSVTGPTLLTASLPAALCVIYRIYTSSVNNKLTLSSQKMNNFLYVTMLGCLTFSRQWAWWKEHMTLMDTVTVCTKMSTDRPIRWNSQMVTCGSSSWHILGFLLYYCNVYY